MASSYNNAQASSSSADPYAQFYYWDTNANDWAFDYDRYYATYGYPSQNGGASSSSSAHLSNAAYVQHQQQQAAAAYNGQNGASSSRDGGAGGSSGNAFGIHGVGSNGGGSAALDHAEQQPNLKRKRPVAGPKDEEGNAIAGKLTRGETRETVLRKAPGNHVYEDRTLMEWDPSHKRLFVGDLGNDVTDAVLIKAFEKYPSFSKGRVVRRKQDDKSKGYGFVSFADPHDFLKAWKEMDGKHIGSRPCRLKKASEDVAPTTIGWRKDKLLAANAKYDAYKSKSKMGGAIGGDLRRHGVGKAWKQK